MKTLFIGGMDTETNSFSPLPTGRAQFALAFGDGTSRPLNSCSAQLAVWRRMAGAQGLMVHEGLCAVAEPGGFIPRAVYEDLRDRLLDGIARARPAMILLALHGAALAHGYDDVEGDLLERARTLAGPDTFLGATLDPHCHLTDRMVGAADALVLYKEYPHTDIDDTAADLFAIGIRTLRGTARPVMATWDCRMIASYPTQNQPMRGFVDAMRAAERDMPGVLSVSLAHGFAHADVPDVGAKMLVIADKSRTVARATAEHFGRRFYALRNQVTPRFLDLEAAMERIAAHPGGRPPLVLADTGDNPGGGAAGDATFMVHAALARGLENIAFAMFWDPVVVEICMAAGVGARLDMRLGGKCGPQSGHPVDLVGARVRAIGTTMRQRFGSVELPMGNAVWLEAHGLNLIVNDLRTQVFDPVCMTALGLDLGRQRAVMVKSLNHFAALFAPVAGDIIHVATPGTTSVRYGDIPYTRRSPDYWPRLADPLGTGAS
ncbi:M81 family metallopeptidase [Nguyenibacter sp. L1]|uniref:M81 family metallopeptidase n=1 Tax=Nguyenibacter sp. L1 TaxID=3049350 RepID=UPI002B486AB2|nr:M81 family metallopeptidase [Nguyenibacter sp. L1]WRH86687.1 M81 family metallopeptidase [Nguyenibacter sp. L1]